MARTFSGEYSIRLNDSSNSHWRRNRWCCWKSRFPPRKPVAITIFVYLVTLAVRREPTIVDAFPQLLRTCSHPSRNAALPRSVTKAATVTNFEDSLLLQVQNYGQRQHHHEIGSECHLMKPRKANILLEVMPAEGPRRNAPPLLQTWRRRLITKEDKFHVHKITGVCFMVASTAIMLGGITTKFSSIPTWLNSATQVLVWSGWLQLYTSVTMTRQFRSRIDEKAAFLVTAIGSSLTNFLALWFSPFCPSILIRHPLVAHIAVAINTVCLWLPMWSFVAHPMDTIQRRQPESSESATFSWKELMTSASSRTTTWHQLRDAFAYFVQIPMINLAASRMIFQLHAQGRDFFLTSWVLRGTPAQNMAIIFYSMVFLSMASNYVALTATLRDKHLISQNTESGIMALLGAVSVLLISRALF